MNPFRSLPSNTKPESIAKAEHERLLNFYIQPAMSELARAYLAGEPLTDVERFIVEAALQEGRKP